jgi:hypothetical protein
VSDRGWFSNNLRDALAVLGVVLAVVQTWLAIVSLRAARPRREPAVESETAAVEVSPEESSTADEKINVGCGTVGSWVLMLVCSGLATLSSEAYPTFSRIAEFGGVAAAVLAALLTWSAGWRILAWCSEGSVKHPYATRAAVLSAWPLVTLGAGAILYFLDADTSAAPQVIKALSLWSGVFLFFSIASALLLARGIVSEKSASR